jgi:hypothetical protein
METVEFKFSPNQRVTTPFGDAGIVDTCAIDNSGDKTYFVKTSAGGNWFKEDQLTA